MHGEKATPKNADIGSQLSHTSFVSYILSLFLNHIHEENEERIGTDDWRLRVLLFLILPRCPLRTQGCLYHRLISS